MKEERQRVSVSRDRPKAPDEPSGRQEGKGSAQILGLVAEETQAKRRAQEVVLGNLVRLGDSGEAWVDFPENPARKPVPARSTVSLDETEVGREVALLFEAGDPAKPIIMGFLRQPTPTPQPRREGVTEIPKAPPVAELDGETVVLSAEKEIVLRCGDASITLTRAGKILLRGKYLLSRSSGVNRIKGGSVQIN